MRLALIQHMVMELKLEFDRFFTPTKLYNFVTPFITISVIPADAGMTEIRGVCLRETS